MTFRYNGDPQNPPHDVAPYHSEIKTSSDGGQSIFIDAARPSSEDTIREPSPAELGVNIIDRDGQRSLLKIPLHRKSLDKSPIEAASMGFNITDFWLPPHDATRAGSKDAPRVFIRRKSDKGGRTPLHDAALDGSEHAISVLLDKGADINVVDEGGRTPLHDAALNGSRNFIHKLLYKGADVNAVDKHGWTPLHDAAQAGSLDAISVLLDRGADINAVDKEGQTPLHHAARAGLKNVIRKLLFNGANVNAIDKHGWTPLHDAARAGSRDAISSLLFRGASIKAVDKKGQTPLHDAARADSPDAIDALLFKGTDVHAIDERRRTPLHDAWALSRDAIWPLLDRGADINAVDKDGRTLLHDADVNATDNNRRTPLHEAARCGSKAAVDILLRRGADVYAMDNRGRTPLHDAARGGSKDLIRELLMNGADLNARDSDGRTPLHDAARGDSKDLIRELLMNGADLNARDSGGRTPLHEVARGGSKAAVKILFRRGADVYAMDNSGRTPLHDAAQGGSKDLIEELLLFGVDVNARDSDGRTPLHAAARGGSKDLIRELLMKGADLNARDSDGRTPLHDAARGGSKDPIQELLRGGADANANDKYGRTPLYDAVRACSEDYIMQLLSSRFLGLVEYNGDIVWEGLETYQNCDGAIGDILTISRSNCPEDHCYIARSFSSFLSDYYPAFGVEILNWIIKICEQCQELENSICLPDSINVETRNSKLDLDQINFDSADLKAASRHISAEGADLYPVREILVKDTTYATIEGRLVAGKLKWAISSYYEKLALDVKLALSWALAVLRCRSQGVEGLFSWNPVSLDAGLPEIARFSPTRTESYCWTNLFSYACIALLPSFNYMNNPATEGLEIDFCLLLELAAVDREILTEDGLIFFGFDTALIPLEPPESRRWHFMVTEGRQITPARVNREFGKRKETKGRRSLRFKGKLEPDFRNGKAYVGWCAAPVVTFGTIDSDTAAVDVISMSSGLPNVKKLEESVERSSGNDLSFFSRIGFLGSSIGASRGKKKDTKFQQVNVVAKRTLRSNFEGILASARATPCILWDQSVERAWLVSAVSTLLFASLRYAKWNKYSFKRRKNDGQFESAEVHHACEDSTNITSGSESALRQSQMFLVDKADGIAVNDEILFGDIVKQMWLEMTDGEDVCISSTTGSKYKMNKYILGYDLNEAICGTRKQMRQLPVSPCIQSWQPLAHVENAQIIFCRNVGVVVRCDSATNLVKCCARTYPKGALSCLLEDLKTFYGGCWDKPLNSPPTLSIGNEYEWVPNGCDSVSQEVCFRSLQFIVASKPQRKKLIKQHAQIRVKQTENGRTVSPLTWTFPTLVTFGSDLV